MSGGNRFIECLIGIVIAFVIISFVSALTPQSIKSLSVIDLLVNNLTNIALAVAISLFAVQNYESKRQRLAFIIDLLKQTDFLCDSMKDIVTDICSDCSMRQMKIDVKLYQSYTRSLAEYTDAICKQLDETKGKKNKESKRKAHEMHGQSDDHMKRLFKAVELHGNDTIKVAEFIINDELQILLSVQTYIPKILAYIKY